MRRPCLDCGVLADGSRCPEHARARMARTDREYGHGHRQLRAAWAADVALGVVRCARCRDLIGPADPWDMGHDDTDRGHYSGPEHARCNRATAAHRVAG